MSMLLFLNLLGFVINGLGVWATWLCGKHHRGGWLWNALGQIGWIVYSILLLQWSLVPWEIAWAAIYWKNYRMWPKQRSDNGSIKCSDARSTTSG